MHSKRYYSNRKTRTRRMLQRMAAMRAAKERLRLERADEPEPIVKRSCFLEIGVRDKVTGISAWTDFRSVRDAARRLSIIRKFYMPGPSP